MDTPGEQRLESQQRPEDDKPTIAEAAIQDTVDTAATLVWDGEHAYIVITESGHVRTLAVRSSAFKRWLISRARADDRKAPSNHQQWQVVMEALESRAEEGGIQSTPSIRVAGKARAVNASGEEVAPAAVYIDLGDEKWNCVKVTRNGWEVGPHPADGPYFYRPKRLASLPMPKSNGDVRRLWYFLNAADSSEQQLLTAALVQALWPRGPYPILTVHGPHGSTKTTRVNVFKSLTDPTLSSPEIPAVSTGRKPPKDERSIIAAARNNRVVAFDNVSYLDQWLSDALCRLATGAELGDRGLYTDFDEAVFAASRPVLINGIPDVVGQSDLADRCIQTKAHRPEHTKDEVEFWNEFRAEWPLLLGALLDLLSATLRHWGKARENIAEDVRMKNYARIGEALGVELGWKPGEFTLTYAENLRGAARDIAQQDPVYDPLLHVLEAHGGEWTGRMKDLLEELNQALNSTNLASASEIRKAREWPGSPKALGNKLTRLAPALAHDGVTVGETIRAHSRTTRTITASGAHRGPAVPTASAPDEPAEGTK